MEQTTWEMSSYNIFDKENFYINFFLLNILTYQELDLTVFTTKGNLLPLKSLTILISNGIMHYHGRLIDCVA